ncbi:MAG TPA: YceI family protein [Steroidobacteraceae bacterium]|jgi:polyisoprenoid-binding protein YceI|nr:YceI family protein [Steroidobacteraceae bacterium]
MIRLIRALSFGAIAILAGFFAIPVLAAPSQYTFDPDHTYPSFEASHMGISVWRGKFDRSAGTATLDETAESGVVDIRVDLKSVDFGLAKLNEFMVGPEFFDTAKFPEAHYRGTLAGFVKGVPTRVEGDLTLHGVTKPLALTVSSFKCILHPILKRQLCGADAIATFQRDQFGLDAGKSYGFSMDVTLRIQVEALKNG